MEIKENEIIVKNENFMMFLNLYFKEEYGIGMHGIEGNDCWIEKDGTWELNKEKIDSIKNSILNEGLIIKENRTLMSTMSFDRLERYLSKGTYGAGGIIAALPKNIKNSAGEKIFLGEPIEDSSMISRNYEYGSLSDMILPDYNDNYGCLNSMFILAKYDKIDDENIKITINPNHIYFNGGILPDDYFNIKKEQINRLCQSYGANDIEELLIDANDKIGVKENLFPYEKAIINTSNQFNELDLEKNIRR